MMTKASYIWKAFAALAAAMVAAVALQLCLVTAAHAETISAGWTVTFTQDGKMTSDHAAQKAAIDEALSSLLPGDTFSLDVKLENQNSARTGWYMSADVLDTLEKADNSASGGAYKYKLLYNSNEIYSSDNVGGTGSMGFKEIANATGEWFWLGYIDSGQSGNVSLQMSLDGETQNNDYMNTVGTLGMQFAVEFNDGGGKRVVVEGDEVTPQQQGNPMPQTGDTMGTALMLLAAGAAAAGAGAFAISRRKASKRSDS
ncbi:MAG: LPXTG cell wall anchor domain-containing protein [Eggerthellaceae bacterium]|nr:LPXTG cell wall anchor domain-containing protein [Eggerthellaceae bacterium]